MTDSTCCVQVQLRVHVWSNITYVSFGFYKPISVMVSDLDEFLRESLNPHSDRINITGGDGY